MMGSILKTWWEKSDEMTMRVAGILAPLVMLEVVVSNAASISSPFWSAFTVYSAFAVLGTAAFRQACGFGWAAWKH